jgi:hypothetical protein
LRNAANRSHRATGGRSYGDIYHDVEIEIQDVAYDYSNPANNGFFRKSARDLETVVLAGGSAGQAGAQQVFLMADDARRGLQYRTGISDSFTAYSGIGQLKAGGAGYGDIAKGAVVGTVLTPVNFARSVAGRINGNGSLDELGETGFNTLLLLASARGTALDPKLATLTRPITTAVSFSEAIIAALRPRDIVQLAQNLKSRGLLRLAREGELEPNEQGFALLDSGEIVLRPGMSLQDFAVTLKHEAFHSTLTRALSQSARDARANLYGAKGLWTFFEEAGAEAAGTGSLGKGLSFPGNNGYLSETRFPFMLFPPNVSAEALATP